MLRLKRGAIVYEPVGCEHCSGSGFKGRIGVFEAVRIDEPIRRMINDGSDELAIVKHAFAHTDDLATAARALVLVGETTPEEAVRVSRRDATEPEPLIASDG